MGRIINTFIKMIGILFVLTLVILFVGYKILFNPEMKYHPVRDPEVAKSLSEWSNRKFGLFMHWGPYSQWGVVESWSICAEDEPWCRRHDPDYSRYKQNYESLKMTFNPVHFDPEKWARAAKVAGMRYMVFTTKHHDGFCMFDTGTTDYKVTDDSCAFSADPKANITKEIFDAFRKEEFMVGAYFSKADWNTEYFWWPNFATPDRNVNYNIEQYPERWEDFVNFTHTQIDEIASNYGKVDILWFDGGWVRPLTLLESRINNLLVSLYRKVGYTQINPPQNQDLRMTELAAKVREKQPGIIIVDRHVEGTEQDYMTPEQFVPDTYLPYPWESCITMGNSWSYSFRENYKPAREIIHMLVDVVSKGGNLLLNIGPGPEGTWHDEAYDRLKEIGSWMRVNGNAIYNTHGKEFFGSGNIRFTYNNNGIVNAIYLAEEGEDQMPQTITIENLKIKEIRNVKLLGTDAEIEWGKSGRKINLKIPDKIRENPPCDFAWTFVISP